MKIFINIQHTGLFKNSDIISLALLAENGRKFYAEFNDFTLNHDKVDKEWISNNVLNNLRFEGHEVEVKNIIGESNSIFMKGNTKQIAEELECFFSCIEEEVILVGDCMHYDIVLFNSIFDSNVPENISYIPVDICTMMIDRGIDPDIKRDYTGLNPSNVRNAIFRVELIQYWYRKLTKRELI